MIIVTGATGAIGSHLTMQLVEHGHKFIMACRHTNKAEKIRSNLPNANLIKILRLDLASFDSISSFIDDIKSYKIDVLINNAGCMAKRYTLTEEGYEMNIGVNYFGTVELTSRIIPFMEDGSVIMNVTSIMRYVGSIKYISCVGSHNFSVAKTYAASKKAITLYTRDLAATLINRRIAVNCFDPGIVDSNMITMDKWFDGLADLIFRPLITKPAKTAENLVCAIEKRVTGCIFRGNTYHKI